MTKLVWDKAGERRFETGVDHGVLYLPDTNGVYDNGYSWNGLVTVTESPSGAEATPQYADNMKYLNLISTEDFSATVEAFTYPVQFEQCDGVASPQTGITIGQQGRKPFGLSYRTKVGTDLNPDAGYKLHLVYGGQATPSEKAYSTVNDTPEAITFSWEVSTTPIVVGTIGGTTYKPTATLVVDSTKVAPSPLSDLENALYGTSGSNPRLPTPSEVVAMFAGSLTSATPTAPTYNSTTHVITVPSVTGVQYYMDDNLLTAGAQPAITKNEIVEARPASGYKFPNDVDTDWGYVYP